MFDTSWHWKRAGDLLGIALEDLSDTPSLSYVFRSEKKVLTQKGRWFESAHDYISHRIRSAAKHVDAADVREVTEMMVHLVSAEGEMGDRPWYENFKLYTQKSKHHPQSKALREAYKKFGIVLPEMEAAGVVWRCANCAILEPAGVKFSKCARCEAVAYCSRECQRQHWKTHKVSCVKAADEKPAPTSIEYAVKEMETRKEKIQEDKLELLRRKFGSGGIIGELLRAGEGKGSVAPPE